MINLISVKKKGKKYLLVFEDKKTTEYLVSEDLLLKFNFIKNKEVSKEEYLNFQKEYEIDELYNRTLKNVLNNPKTVKETFEYLDRLSTDQELKSRIVKRLLKYHYLDDDAYFEHYLDYSINIKKEGPIKIKYDLSKKGIDKEINIEDKVLLNNALELIEQLERKYNDITLNALKNKIKTKLYDKGYSFNLIDKAISLYKFKNVVDENKLIKKEYEKALIKYKGDKNEKNKIIAYLARKNFSMDLIFKTVK